MDDITGAGYADFKEASRVDSFRESLSGVSNARANLKVKLEGGSETLEDSNGVDKAIGESDVHGGDEVKNGDKSKDEKDLASPE
ncbi:hypothetical protein PIB30_073114 [Stylosanthes scabra]|uniref:Uncharacterized protein n=1 Tax=Stylosanthes scabra TaxID=79078 RepID=A0ABU6WMJ0_9FABA|nr:hypothetical protein [Stylosanthes scabra]